MWQYALIQCGQLFILLISKVDYFYSSKKKSFKTIAIKNISVNNFLISCSFNLIIVNNHTDPYLIQVKHKYIFFLLINGAGHRQTGRG